MSIGLGGATTEERNDDRGDCDVTGMNLVISGSGDECWMDINSLKQYIAYARIRELPRRSVEATGLLRTNYVFI